MVLWQPTAALSITPAMIERGIQRRTGHLPAARQYIWRGENPGSLPPQSPISTASGLGAEVSGRARVRATGSRQMVRSSPLRRARTEYRGSRPGAGEAARPGAPPLSLRLSALAVIRGQARSWLGTVGPAVPARFRTRPPGTTAVSS